MVNLEILRQEASANFHNKMTVSRRSSYAKMKKSALVAKMNAAALDAM